MNTPEINGKPAVWITVGAAEKVNVGNFSNVDVGPVTLGRWVEDDQKVIDKAFADNQEYVESIVAEERQKVLESLK